LFKRVREIIEPIRTKAPYAAQFAVAHLKDRPHGWKVDEDLSQTWRKHFSPDNAPL
jgi:hypothetical protein